jgi:hypothetical protein
LPGQVGLGKLKFRIALSTADYCATEITMLKKIVIVLIIIFCNYTSFADENNIIPLVTNQSDLDFYIGKVITIRGEVTNTKIPTIIGVDVIT